MNKFWIAKTSTEQEAEHLVRNTMQHGGQPRKRPGKRGRRIGFLVASVFIGVVLFWRASSPFPWGIPLPGGEAIFCLFTLAIALIVTFVGAVLTLPKFSREFGGAMLNGAVVYILAAPLAIIAIFAGNEIRRWGFERFSVRSQPLIAAIRDYDSLNGRPPNHLNELVPDYFAKVPETGIAGSPRYSYRTFVDWEESTRHAGRWMLEVPASTGPLNFDSLIFFPSGQYPAYGWGGRLEPIGDWAHVHE